MDTLFPSFSAEQKVYTSNIIKQDVECHSDPFDRNHHFALTKKNEFMKKMKREQKPNRFHMNWISLCGKKNPYESTCHFIFWSFHIIHACDEW